MGFQWAEVDATHLFFVNLSSDIEEHFGIHMHRRATVPARVNIIGEHTDYAGGLALPFAIDNHLVLDAESRDEGYSGDTTVVNLWQAAGGWPADLKVSSSIPIGKGMSSSAALCLAVVLCARGDIEPLDACKEAQQIEHSILKNPCGLLDQMAMMFAKEGFSTLINFSDNTVDYIAIPEDWVFKLVDSNVHRTLASTPYHKENDVRDAHVIEENNRVTNALSASAEELGNLLNQSHCSLQKLGVSLATIDAQVESLQVTKGVLGARMMGGGFGGMILALVNNPDILPDTPCVVSSGPAFVEEILDL